MGQPSFSAYSLHEQVADNGLYPLLASLSSLTIARTSSALVQMSVSFHIPTHSSPSLVVILIICQTYQFKSGVPIEVVPFAYAKVLQNLHHISPKAKLRMAVAKAGPLVTDNANFIIDAPFDAETMKDPYAVRILPPICPTSCRCSRRHSS